MQLYDISIAPNVTRQLDAPGSYFYYYAGSAGGADSTITLRGVSSGLRLILKPGQAFRLPSGDVETSWILTNYANTATIIGTVLVGDGDITDNRVTGSVEVVDGEKARTLAGGMYSAAITGSPVAGQYPFVQLWNPAGSGKNLIVTQLSLNSTSDVGINVMFENAARPTDQTSYQLLNKKSGSALGVGLVKVGNSATPGATAMLTAFVKTNTVSPWPIKGAVIVTPGYGLTAWASTLGTLITMNAEFFEENI